MDPGELCRAVESYLCRKNDGHLIRIVGPAFEMVCGWAAAGIPLAVVERAIDQRYSRYYAKGPKRRPLRIEYCEADVLDRFDEWKRAVGVGAAGGAEEEPSGGAEEEPSGGSQVETESTAGRSGGARRRRSLAAHLDDLAVRLTAWSPPPGAAALESLLQESREAVEAARSGGRTLRGEDRRRAIERLDALDKRLPAAARADAGESVLRELEAEAQASLEPFRSRMPAPAFARALEAATDRLLAERFGLPRLTFD